MAMHYIEGNLLDAKQDYICHQVNCRGVMGTGVAKAIRNKWPRVYEDYKAKYDNAVNTVANLDPIYGYKDANDILLGSIQIVDIEYNYQYVINMFAQDGYGYDGKRYTSYDAFWMCLEEIRSYVGAGSTIAFPKNIGCCRGGANWKVISTMIEEVLGKDYEVFIYELEENKVCQQIT